MTNPRFPIVILISGRGSNLQAIIDAARRDLPVEIRAVISNQPDALGLERAHRQGISTAVLDHRLFPDREDFDQQLISLIEKSQPGLVVLAGFMRILTPDFVRHFSGRLINIHPSLLPQLPGLHTHERAIAQGLKEHGATVHFVTEQVDSGPIIIQARVPILPDDTPEILAERVLEQEHRIFPQAVRWFVTGRLQIRDGRVWLDDQDKGH
uniref:Phosphoribosylglycinamide formyltransferase n=1 Tax=Candidatus Kentrum sp. MB TaxID=2138164 RepID=A0A450XHP8_9GAMM|nr:MAG: formyltetrahydrofolate-dependent phosphoribosylglycinamide formyltransferase [Candidatus Kentron sp. MB]VFK33966.1 MAG: formyltetrahydrofolate-dependent phosphoribosylglycinamide formyltransferase [Candidatus Kentron sp. MB]VFK76529.1 MAG: formyltetrahydrofolate-dependent phosphoribosylglycinamide formyltransferase [Candidatus Kentron sp. MB]